MGIYQNKKMSVIAKSKKQSKFGDQQDSSSPFKEKLNKKLKSHKKEFHKDFLEKSNKDSFLNTKPKKMVKKKSENITKNKSIKELTKNARKTKLEHNLVKASKDISTAPIIPDKKLQDHSFGEKKLEMKIKKGKKKKSVGNVSKSVTTAPANTCDSREESTNNNSSESAGLLVTKDTKCDDDSTLSSLPQVGFVWGDNMEDLNKLLSTGHEDSEEEDEEVEVAKAKPRLTKAERAALAKAEEAQVRAAEDELLENGDPVSPDAFDRMLLAQPDCSELWVKYMAYHLQATEIEKARAVARRALTVINIRREDDRLNVWTSLMNLEHLYGTRDSLQACVHEALRCNDEVKVYTNLMNIYASSGQIRDLDSTVKLLLKKAGTGHNSVNTYLQCANTLLQHGQKETARHILQRGLNNLPPAVHVTLISRFALAENKHGDPARAQALFEHTLTSYPTRVDVWGVYVDMLVKSDRVDLARQVIQRAVTQKLPPKKLKPLYMKWLKVEEKYGDEQAVESVKREIEQYVKETRGKLSHAKLSL